MLTMGNLADGLGYPSSENRFIRHAVPSYIGTERFQCPACLNRSTFTFEGGEFTGCFYCETIAAKDRRITVSYDREYVAARYDRYKTTRRMSELRLQVLEGVLHLHDSLAKGYGTVQRGNLLDVGYGNGDFIRVACDAGWDAYGYDVNPTEYEGVRRTLLPNEPNWGYGYRVITFFDALEHFATLEEARWVSHATDWLLLSFPAVPPTFPMDASWKHARAGEHMLHFNPKGLEKIFSHSGVTAELVYQGHPEDTIRTPWSRDYPNIHTCALRCYR